MKGKNWIEKQGEQAPSQTNERAWLYLVSDVLTWKDGIGQYLDDPRVQELAKRLCSEYTQKLYSPSVLSNSSNIGKNEQKSTYKLEPKFKVGDWVVTSNGEVSQVISVNKDYDGYTLDNYNYVSGAWCDMYHLWTIDDAKDGDVLISSVNKPFIYDGHFDEIIVGAYCGLYINGDFVIADKENYWTQNINIRPATKEQRDLLFTKMKEAGYEWDDENKRLKKDMNGMLETKY